MDELSAQIRNCNVRVGYYSSGGVVYCAHHIGGRYLGVRGKRPEYYHTQDRNRFAQAGEQIGTSGVLNYWEATNSRVEARP